jgi:hypothetical protein
MEIAIQAASHRNTEVDSVLPANPEAPSSATTDSNQTTHRPPAPRSGPGDLELEPAELLRSEPVTFDLRDDLAAAHDQHAVARVAELGVVG